MGKELENEIVQVRRFIRGLRVKLRTYCSVFTFHTVSELVKRMAMTETNLTEEAKLKSWSQTTSSNHGDDRKRKRDHAEEGKTLSGRPECPKCGRHHGGECWKAMGACTHCGKMDHSARDCPGPEYGRRQGRVVIPDDATTVVRRDTSLGNVLRCLRSRARDVVRLAS